MTDNYGELARTVRYMMQTGTVSSHRVIGIAEGPHVRCVEDDLVAWHAQEDNQSSLSIEFCQALPTDHYSTYQIATGIRVCAEWCQKYDLAPSPETITLHQFTEQGRRNGKSDPGPLFDYVSFVASVQQFLGGD